VSCDVYFYQLGQKLGIETMAAWFSRFGLGRTTASGLPNENPGLVGTPEWKMRVRGQRWYAGESVSVSIGQGPLNTTVLQLARVYAALANGGRLVRPHVIPEIGERAGIDLGLDPTALALVARGLEGGDDFGGGHGPIPGGTAGGGQNRHRPGRAFRRRSRRGAHRPGSSTTRGSWVGRHWMSRGRWWPSLSNTGAAAAPLRRRRHAGSSRSCWG
jgi:hypothetical protein